MGAVKTRPEALGKRFCGNEACMPGIGSSQDAPQYYINPGPDHLHSQ